MSYSTETANMNIVLGQAAYGLHPSPILVELFRKKAWQGQDPQKARAIFVGRDANYSAKVSEHRRFFEHILNYHEDGVAFWRKHGVHHPFLLQDYPFSRVKDGVRYHSTFRKLGLEPDFAGAVSFIELLDVPTIGITGQAGKGVFDALLRREHLEYLDGLMSGNPGRTVFLSPSVVSDMRKVGKRFRLFQWVDQLAGVRPATERPAIVREGTRIYLTYHFSDGRAHAQLPGMAAVIRTACES